MTKWLLSFCGDSLTCHFLAVTVIGALHWQKPLHDHATYILVVGSVVVVRSCQSFVLGL